MPMELSQRRKWEEYWQHSYQWSTHILFQSQQELMEANRQGEHPKTNPTSGSSIKNLKLK